MAEVLSKKEREISWVLNLLKVEINKKMQNDQLITYLCHYLSSHQAHVHQENIETYLQQSLGFGYNNVKSSIFSCKPTFM